jgi:putative ABC transport system permease protein
VPIDLNPTQARGNHFLDVFGRLRDGVTRAQAEGELATVAARLSAQYPETNRDWTVRVVHMREAAMGEYKSILAIMMGAVGFVLLIACANVANLLMARATGRGREIAVRTALGAGRGRIIRQLLTESVLLSGGGAMLGLLVAAWGLDLVVAAIPPDSPFWLVFTIDWRVLLFTSAVAIGSGLLFGLAPAFQALRTDLHETLKEGSRGAGTGGQRHRLRNTLVVSEVALSTVLLIGAALMIRSFLSLSRVEPGFDRANLMTFSVTLQGRRYDSVSTRTAFYDDLVGRLRAIPGTASAGGSTAAPLSGSRVTSSFSVEGQPVEAGRQPLAAVQSVTGGFVTHLGIPIREGRDIATQEVREKAPVALVSQTMAQRFWPNESAIGKRFRFGGVTSTEPWMTVVGVTGDVRQQEMSDRPENQAYVPYPAYAFRRMNLQVRMAGSPLAAGPAIRAAVRAIDPTLPVIELQTMDDAIAFRLWEQRLYSGMFGSFAAVALLLAAIGLYGVMSYLVSLRTHEIGVRMALGAGRNSVLGLVVGRGVVLAGIGLVIGVAGAFGMTRVLRDLLYGVGTLDPISFAGIPLVLGAVAALASYVPARRASGVDPVVVLRSE